jgi:radical SAM protein with 4Fe4S-binding SPASM domain
MSDCSIPLEEFKVLVNRFNTYTNATHKRLAYFGSLEMTPYCNLQCRHCYVTGCKQKQEGQLLTTSECYHLIDDITAEGCIWLLLTGGEPLIRNDFLDIYAYVKKKGIFTFVFTNGTLITPEIARYFHKLPPALVEISIYGATKTTYESITQIPGSFERCLRGIELLLGEGIKLKLKTILMTLNKHEYWEMKRLAKTYGVEFRMDPLINPALDTIYTCGAGVGSFHINSFGRLLSCTLVPQPSYDLRKGSFSEGWHHFMTDIRARKLSQPSPCRSCGFRLICHICAGWAQLEHGTLEEQPVDFLCQVARLRTAAFATKKPETNGEENKLLALNPLRVEEYEPEKRKQ